MLPPLHLERSPMQHGSTRVRLYAPPPGTPRCAVILQGAMPAELSDWLARLLRLGARALGVPLTESGRSRHADDARVR